MRKGSAEENAEAERASPACLPAGDGVEAAADVPEPPLPAVVSKEGLAGLRVLRQPSAPGAEEAVGFLDGEDGVPCEEGFEGGIGHHFG